MSIFGDYLPELLPDDPNKNAAARQGLLAFAGAMMNNRGGLLSGAGNGLVAAGSEYHNSLTQQQQQQQQQALRDAQIKQIGLDTQISQSKLDLPGLRAKAAAAAQGYGSISAGTPGSVPPISALPQLGQPRPQVAQQAGPMGGANFNMGYGNDAPEAMPDMPPQAAPARQPVAQDQASSMTPYQAQMLLAQSYRRFGLTEDAKDAEATANQMKPKYATEFRQATGPDGKLRNYLLADDGSDPKEVGLGVKPDMVESDLGGRKVWSDRNSITPGQSFNKTITPGERQQSADQAAARAQADRHWKAEQADGAPFSGPSNGLTGAEYLNSLDKSTQAQVVALTQGRMAFPVGRAAQSEYWQKMIATVAQYDPSFDAVNYGARAKTRNDLAAGKTGSNIKSINTAVAHMGQLDDQLTALDNSDSSAVNVAHNWAAKTFGNRGRQEKIAAVDTTAEGVAGEMAKVFRDTGMSEKEIDAWRKKFESSTTPAAQKGTMRSAVHMLQGRMDAIQDQYQTGMGTTARPLDILTPKAKEIFDRLGAEQGNAPAGPPKVPIKPVGELKKIQPPAGTVKGGFRFNGKGDAGNPANWEKVQ